MIKQMLVSAVVVCGIAAAPAQRGPDVVTSTWFRMSIGGVPVGWLHTIRTDRGDGTSTRSEMHLSINRLGSQITMATTDEAHEGTNGDLIAEDLELHLSQQATALHAVVKGDSLHVESEAGGHSFARRLPRPDVLLGPTAADRLTSTSLHVPGDSLKYHVFSPQADTVVQVTRTLQAMDTVQLRAARVPARKIIERSAASPVPVTLWLDVGGNTLRTAYASPFGLTESVTTDSVTAVTVKAKAMLNDDQYTRTIVPTGVRIMEPRRADRVQIALTPLDTSMVWPDLADDAQRIISTRPNELIFEVARRPPPSGTHPFPVMPTAETESYLAPNAYVQSEDPTLHALALRIVGQERDVYRASLLLERWVHAHMKPDLGVVFAPSVEVLAHRRGTCIAYATLLAALTRTLGIPSRVVFGYVYLNGMFGGHAWTEVLDGPEWVGVDAAIVPDGPVDAARFAFARSSLADGGGGFVTRPGARLYGAIKARFTGVALSGQRMTVVDSTAAPYVIAGDEYQNGWLGVTVSKPHGFRFSDMDVTWPASTFLVLRGPRNEQVGLERLSRLPWDSPSGAAAAELEQRAPGGVTHPTTVADMPAWQRDVPGHAIIVVPIGGDLIVVDASGPDAARLVTQVASTLEMKDQ